MWSISHEKAPRGPGTSAKSLDLYACVRLQMNVEFACVRNSVLGMRAHAKLETGHVTELLQVPLRKLEKSWFHPNLLMRNLQ